MHAQVPELSRQGSDLPAKSPRILIVRAGAIGDTLMATPLVRALRKSFPGAYLAFLCSRMAEEVLKYNPNLDEVFALSYRRLPFWLSPEKQRLTRRLRSMKLDWALALESNPRLLDVVIQARPTRLIAYSSLPAEQGFEQARFDPQLHSIQNHLNAAEPLGVRPTGHAMDLHYPADWDEAVRQRLEACHIGSQDCLVGIHPGWGGRKHSIETTRLRSWPAQNFAEVIRRLVKARGVRVVLTGSAADRELAESIVRLAGVPCLNLAGKLPLLELAALIRRLNLYLTVDSGPAHIAAALGTPLITLWGPGILEQTAPLAGSGPVTILRHQVHCAPCYGTPLMKTCRDNICMKQIGVDETLEAVGKTLSGLENASGTTQGQSWLRPQA